MDLGLRNKSALLIGAGRGLGAATALALAREGCKVALVARTREAVEARAAECLAEGAPVALGISADATDPDELSALIEQAASELGSLDILVTLVGGSDAGGTESEVWQRAFDRNLWPAIRASKFALPHLTGATARRSLGLPTATLEQPRVRAARSAEVMTAGAPHRAALPTATLEQTRLRGASHRARAQPTPQSAEPCGPQRGDASVIVHVSSIFGREGGGALSYNVAKAALISLAHEQARELAPRNVRVLSVAPGSILHPGGSWERRLQKDPKGTNAFVKREIPFGRFGTAAEVGDVIAFLCSPRASWVSGACVVIDGAQSRSF